MYPRNSFVSKRKSLFCYPFILSQFKYKTSQSFALPKKSTVRCGESQRSTCSEGLCVTFLAWMGSRLIFAFLKKMELKFKELIFLVLIHFISFDIMACLNYTAAVSDKRNASAQSREERTCFKPWSQKVRDSRVTRRRATLRRMGWVGYCTPQRNRKRSVSQHDGALNTTALERAFVFFHPRDHFK